MSNISQERIKELIELHFIRFQKAQTSGFDFLIGFLILFCGIWYAYGSALGGFLAGYAVVIIKATSDTVRQEVIKTDIYRLLDEHWEGDRAEINDRLLELKKNRSKFW